MPSGEIWRENDLARGASIGLTRAADGLWLFVRPVGFMVGMGVDGWSMTMDLQRIIAKFGRSESIASHTTRKISL
jgi:hypothetical protein